MARKGDQILVSSRRRCAFLAEAVGQWESCAFWAKCVGHAFMHGEIHRVGGVKQEDAQLVTIL